MSENTGAHLPRMMRNAYSLTEVKSVVDQSILLMVHVSGSLHTAILHFPFTLCMCDVFLHLSCLPPTFPPLKLHLKHFFEVFIRVKYIFLWFCYSNMQRHWFQLLLPMSVVRTTFKNFSWASFLLYQYTCKV